MNQEFISLLIKIEDQDVIDLKNLVESPGLTYHEPENIKLKSIEEEVIKNLSGLPITIPIGIAGVKILLSLIENYYKTKQSKEIEITNTENGKNIKIKGFSFGETEEIIKKYLSE